MSHSCPSCGYGSLQPAKITYVRRWGDHLITIPGFPAWQCDVCRHTVYDNAALARVELIFGPDVETLMESPFPSYRAGSGPGERGPDHWPY